MTGRLYLVSLGPGDAKHITPAAQHAIADSALVVGYEPYLDHIRHWLKNKTTHSTPLSQERERARFAVEAARSGQRVSLVSSGDIGVYAMATVAFEEMAETDSFAVEVVPGITAANACASLLGAPLSHDFATLSLSDLLCPWDWIEARASAIAQSDLCVGLYNVQSKGRPNGIYKIIDILLRSKSADTVCGVVRNAYRDEQQLEVCSLGDLKEKRFDMLTTIIVGNKFTKEKRGHIFTPRGYSGWEQDPSTTKQIADTPQEAVWIFSGTSDGNKLATELANASMPVVLSVSTQYGAEIAQLIQTEIPIVAGRLGKAKRISLMQSCEARAIVDATHPFASTISQQLVSIAETLNIPYLRYERPRLEIPTSSIVCDSITEAGARAIALGKRIFLATGVKQLKDLLAVPNADSCEWFLRATPDLENLELALAAGIKRSNLCIMQGPFSIEFNRSLWNDWQIDCVITRESGSVGGFSQKAAAARELQIPLIVIRRPQSDLPNSVTNFLEIIDRFKPAGAKT